jgi:hypothetical protein
MKPKDKHPLFGNGGRHVVCLLVHIAMWGVFWMILKIHSLKKFPQVISQGSFLHDLLAINQPPNKKNPDLCTFLFDVQSLDHPCVPLLVTVCCCVIGLTIGLFGRWVSHSKSASIAMENIRGFANHGSRYMVPTSARGFSLFGTWSSWVRVGYMYTLDWWFSIKIWPSREGP